MKPRVPIPRASRFEDFDELTLLAGLVWGEARGESSEGKRAVAWVVRNRVNNPDPKRFGDGWHGVILKPFQFSCFLANDANSRKILNPVEYSSATIWAECYAAAACVYFAAVPDPTAKADHYHTAGVSPAWSRGRTPTVVIGAHRFFHLG